MKAYLAPQNPAHNRRAVVLWGSGTMGSAIHRALRAGGCVEQFSQHNRWNQPASLAQDAFGASSSSTLAEADELHHIFAAGNAGFSSNSHQCDSELAAWDSVLAGLQQRRDARPTLSPPRSVKVHLTSSAGGLFEGQSNISATSVPDPRRAYGRLKLQQEELLLNRIGAANSHIYRLSSVYGKAHPGRRGSLIGNLLVDSFAHRVTRVTGNLDTLRDYIHADDAATFIVGRILGTNITDNRQPETLASGRAASILEVLQVVERATQRKPLIAFENAHNAASISFLPAALPKGFRPTDLRTGIGSLVKTSE